MYGIYGGHFIVGTQEVEKCVNKFNVWGVGVWLVGEQPSVRRSMKISPT